MRSKITVGTRGSKLALIQADFVIENLRKAYPELEIDKKIIQTTGDKILDEDLSKIGGKGLFIKEIEEALITEEIDLAVHSMKDVPHTLPDDFIISAIMEREDPRDVLISRYDPGLDELQSGITIGTSSTRRILQLQLHRPDLKFRPMRGNIDTRINKLAQGEYDAIVLAAAGIKRMGWNAELFKLKINYLEISDFIPAVGQGALAIEIRKNDADLFQIVQILNHDKDSRCVLAERSFLKEIDGGCEIPVGAYCEAQDDKIVINGFIGDEKLSVIYKEKVLSEIENYEIAGIQLAKKVRYLMKSNI